MPDTKEKLANCQFCGGEAIENYINHDYRDSWSVLCHDCGASTDRWGMNKEEAIAAWNKRDTPVCPECGSKVQRVLWGCHVWCPECKTLR